MKTIRLITVGFLIIALLCSCDTYSKSAEVDTEKQEGRLKVVSEQIYSDSQGSGIEMLVVFDSVSGKEFIAISGMAIAPIE